VNALETGLYSALTGGTALAALLAGSASVYNVLAPQGAALPYVVFNWMTETPSHTFGGVALEDFQYQVKGVTEGPSMKRAGEIRDAIDNLLDDGIISVSGYGTRYIRRISGVSYAETVDGQRFNHRGGIYRIMLDPT
jgi:hypothetical protein